MPESFSLDIADIEGVEGPQDLVKYIENHGVAILGESFDCVTLDEVRQKIASIRPSLFSVLAIDERGRVRYLTHREVAETQTAETTAPSA